MRSAQKRCDHSREGRWHGRDHPHRVTADSPGPRKLAWSIGPRSDGRVMKTIWICCADVRRIVLNHADTGPDHCG